MKATDRLLHIAARLRAGRDDPVGSHDFIRQLAEDEGIPERILALLAKHPGGMSGKQISLATGIEQVSVSPWLRPMERAGILVEAGKFGKPRVILWALATQERKAA